MKTTTDAIASATYALFALLQPVALDELAEGGRGSTFPVAATSTPDWFSAAASQDSSLLETAPELLVLAPDRDASQTVDVTGIDLIHVYAPELEKIEELEEEPKPAPVAAPATPRTSTQMVLLKELSNLDT
jgi:hypothetical protein